MRTMQMTNNEAYDALNLLVRLREKGRLGFVIAKNIRILREFTRYRCKLVSMRRRKKNRFHPIDL